MRLELTCVCSLYIYIYIYICAWKCEIMTYYPHLIFIICVGILLCILLYWALSRVSSLKALMPLNSEHTQMHIYAYKYIYIYIYIYTYTHTHLLISSNAKSADERNDSIVRYSIYNIHVIQKKAQYEIRVKWITEQIIPNKRKTFKNYSYFL